MEIMGIKINPRKLFLVDSLGALLTAIMLGLIVARFETTFGMPSKVLHILSFVAGLFAIYSFLCFYKKIENWQLFMKIIAIANLLYCCITTGLMVYFNQKLTVIGFLYFVFEIIIIVILASIEWKTAAKL